MKKVIIIGGGPAGMMAAIQSASCGCDVTIVEKNEKFIPIPMNRSLIFLISMDCLQKWSVESAFFRHRINLLMSSEHWRRSVKDLV